MGFVSVTCSNCTGKGLVTVEYYAGMMLTFHKKPCSDCDGVGSHLVHTGQIGSTTTSIDPAGANEDEAWATMFCDLDNDVVKVLDFDQIDRQPTKLRGYTQRTVFGQNGRWE